MKHSCAVYWLRRDLRCLDNPALSEACRLSEQVYAIFIATPAQWQTHSLSAIQSDFIAKQLEILRAELAELNIPLLVLCGDDFSSQPSLLLKWCETLGATAIFANKELEWNEVKRDEWLQNHSAGIHCYWFDERCVFPPGSIVKANGEPYKVFTPFSQCWRQQLREKGVNCTAKPHKKSCLPPIPQYRDALMDWPYIRVDSSHYPLTEQAPLTRLRQFCSEQVQDYQQQRDYPALDATSGLSPYLAIGVLSSRQCVARLLLEQGAIDELSAGGSVWLNELIWREFYQHVMVAWPHVMKGKCFKPQYEGMAWQNNPVWFKAWCTGTTGFPLIDAAMRQLNETGWMHNRLRMIVASFLCKDLLIDWRWGEQYFMSRLIDGDLSANNGGWQWAASTGTDATPYFRIFNPVTQSQRFDPNGHFIRCYLKELAALSNKQIHLAGDGVFYRAAIVDHQQQRLRALELYPK